MFRKKHRKAKTENSCWQSNKSSQEYIAHFTLYLFVYSYLLFRDNTLNPKFQSVYFLSQEYNSTCSHSIPSYPLIKL